jgi:hypothetical protein
MKTLMQINDSSNAFTLQFEDSLLTKLRASYEAHVRPFLDSPEYKPIFTGGQLIAAPLNIINSPYFMVSYGKYPLFWISSDTPESYKIFVDFFKALDITDDLKKLVDYDENIIVYSGFFVVGDRAPVPNWHVDSELGANAYTLITPLYPLDKSHGNLLYKCTDGKTLIHNYKLNEAVIFGDTFEHSTQPYPRSENPRIMLSLTFGTDKMSHWDILKKTIYGQSNHLMLPNGVWTKVSK